MAIKLVTIAVPVVALAALLTVAWYLYDVAPAPYAEKKTLTLSFEQNPPWRSSLREKRAQVDDLPLRESSGGPGCKPHCAHSARHLRPALENGFERI
jgi:hypothetical protein